jgi:protein SCO1/2
MPEMDRGLMGKLKSSDKIGLALTAIISLGAISSSAQIADLSPPELQKIDVVEHPGEQIPLDLTFHNESGEIVTLGDYFGQDKPVILILAYYDCPMLCTLVLNGISGGIRELSWIPGREYQMVTVSIDPRETAELAAGKKKVHLDDLSMPIAGDGWAFLVGEEDQSKALAEALGFIYYYDEERKQYAHPAVVFILTEEGTISRYLYGIEFDSRNLRLALLEASEGKIGNTLDRIILYCYHYDPDAQGYVVFAANVMRLGGGITLIALLIFLGVMWGRERRKRSSARSSMIEGK